MKLRLVAAGLLMVGSSAAFANAPMTFSDIDGLQAKGVMRFEPLDSAEMDATEGNAVPIFLIAGLAAGATGGAISALTSPDPSLARVAWHMGTGFTGAAVAATAPTWPLVGGVAAIFGGAAISAAPMPELPCSIFATCQAR